jgi:D-inositol-3-phosphate glycosyltransferase
MSGNARTTLPAIAIIDTLGSHGGMHYYVHDQANALVEVGHRVLVFSSPASTDAKARYQKIAGFERVFGNDPKVVRGARLAWGVLKSLARAKREGASSVIFHIFKGDVFEYIGTAAAYLLNIQPVCIVHDVERLDRKVRHSLMKRICQMSFRLIVHNTFSRSVLLTQWPEFSDKTAIVPHGNYTSQFADLPSTKSARATLDLPSDRFVLLFFGNPRHEKGLHILLEALAQARSKERLLLVIAGKLKPDMLKATTDYVKAHDLQASVRIDAGHVSDELVASYFRAADIVVLPYLRVYESGVALMAMTLGRPVIASELPPLVDAVGTNGERGYLFPAGNPQKLAEQIDAALQDDARLQAKGIAAGDFARQERDWRRSAELTSAALRR